MPNRERVLSIRVTKSSIERVDAVAAEFGLSRSATARLMLAAAVTDDGVAIVRRMVEYTTRTR